MMLFLLFLLALSDAAVVEHKLSWKESTAVQMIRRGEFAAYRNYVDDIAKRTSVSQPLTDYIYYEYMGNVTIGTPDQQFVVVLDTASANFWIPGPDCSEYCDSKHKFDSSKSSSFQKDGRQWKITYSSGTAAGIYGIDTVKFGATGENQLAIPSTVFGIASTVSSDFKYDPKEGILGLAFTSLAVDSITPPFINALNQGLLDQPLFTVWLDQRGTSSQTTAGVITYGAIDTTNCGPVISWQPLSSATYYQYKADGVKLGSYSSVKTYQVISDTATSFISGPQTVTDALAKAAGASWDQSNQVYNIPCDGNTNTLDYTIGGIAYSIQPDNYILEIDSENKQCLFALIPLNFGGFGPQWILGNPFTRQFCNIYDVGRQRMGFSAAKME